MDCCARTPRFSVRERAELPGLGRRVGWGRRRRTAADYVPGAAVRAAPRVLEAGGRQRDSGRVRARALRSKLRGRRPRVAVPL